MMKLSTKCLYFVAAAGWLASAAWLIAPADKPVVKNQVSAKSALRTQVRNRAPQDHSELARLLRLTETDPVRAKRELAELPVSSERDEVVLSVAGELVRTDFQGAIELAETLPSTPPRDEVLERAVREWALIDPAGAIAHAKSFTDEPLRERLLGAALVEWSETDPFKAASSAATELLEGRIQEDAIVSISQRWAQSSPAEASAWIESFPQSALQDAARASSPAPK